MSNTVAIIDYGLGNLFSIENACRQVGLLPVITADPKTIRESDALILPGVGAFGDAMSTLKEKHLVEQILDYVSSGKPFMGICLGMQLLFTESEEFGTHRGLDLVKGKIVRFPKENAQGEKVRVPQIQWNQVYKNDETTWNHSPMKAIGDGSYFHFVHSYYAVPENREQVLSFSEYEGVRYASSVISGNITGIQFHPEKSAEQGLSIYRNWANYIKNKSY